MTGEPTRYRLVPATEEDKPWLEQLRRAVYQELFFATWGGWDEARHQRHCAACWERGHIHIVEIDGQRAGMIQRVEYADAVEIAEVQIQPSHQGRGIGSRLLKDAIVAAHAQDKKVFLAVGLQNRAVKLYERLGFERVSQSETHIQMESPRPAGQGR